MAYMRGTYYVYLTGTSGVAIHVGGILRSDDPMVIEGRLNPDTPEAVKEYDDARCKFGSIILPERVMEELAVKFWLELSSAEKQKYMEDPHYEPYRIRARKKDENG